ncbi:hypothetical protein OH77DRAFT_69097 [Trametes cingulata]|nr:hypothetical protein OH77DRAFT_69097 [Trametes cingulata]
MSHRLTPYARRTFYLIPEPRPQGLERAENAKSFPLLPLWSRPLGYRHSSRFGMLRGSASGHRFHMVTQGVVFTLPLSPRRSLSIYSTDILAPSRCRRIFEAVSARTNLPRQRRTTYCTSQAILIAGFSNPLTHLGASHAHIRRCPSPCRASRRTKANLQPPLKLPSPPSPVCLARSVNPRATTPKLAIADLARFLVFSSTSLQLARAQGSSVYRAGGPRTPGFGHLCPLSSGYRLCVLAFALITLIRFSNTLFTTLDCSDAYPEQARGMNCSRLRSGRRSGLSYSVGMARAQTAPRGDGSFLACSYLGRMPSYSWWSKV